MYVTHWNDSCRFMYVSRAKEKFKLMQSARFCGGVTTLLVLLNYKMTRSTRTEWWFLSRTIFGQVQTTSNIHFFFAITEYIQLYTADIICCSYSNISDFSTLYVTWFSHVVSPMLTVGENTIFAIVILHVASLWSYFSTDKMFTWGWNQYLNQISPHSMLECTPSQLLRWCQ